MILALAVSAFFLFRGGARKIRALVEGPKPIPHFAFVVAGSSAAPADAASAHKLAGRAKRVATQVAATMDALYTEAFLDPNDWQDGSYDNMWTSFTDAAATAAQQQLDVVTLGADASHAYRSVAPHRSKLSVRVLFDPKDQPTTAVAVVTFQADATDHAGKSGTAIVSVGQWFLRWDAGTWKVYAFDVKRADHPMELPVGPSAGPTASAGAS